MQATNSTSKIRDALGGIADPAPLAPYPGVFVGDEACVRAGGKGWGHWLTKGHDAENARARQARRGGFRLLCVWVDKLFMIYYHY